MKKYQLDFNIVQTQEVAKGCKVIKLQPIDAQMPEILPGQFVNVLVPDTPGVMLRRPISVNFVDYENQQLWLMVKNAGKGTDHLCSMKEGERLNLLLPLGNGFSTNFSAGENVLLVGGGVGAAPMLYLAAALRKNGVNVDILIGGRTADDIAQKELLALYGNAEYTTEDGSLGVKGFVTNHPWMQSKEYKRILCCGPMPMMKNVASMASKLNIACDVSLENTMACGLGACLCCVEDTKDKGNVCVCTDGPVFEASKLNW